MLTPVKTRSTDSLRLSLPTRGFSLVEVLVVVAVISVLVSVLIPASMAVRTRALTLEEQSAARQLMIGYTVYADDHRDALLPGYRTGLTVKTFDGERLTGQPAARYPWRIAPYLDDNFAGLYTGRQREALEKLNQVGEIAHYRLSLHPSLGLNTVFLGGDEEHFGFLPRGSAIGAALGDFYARSMAQVKRPDQVITFISARGREIELGLDIEPGYFRVLPPSFPPSQAWTDRSWSEDIEPGNFGHIDLRHRDQAVIATVDGAVSLQGETALKDMRKWSGEATRADWSPVD